MLKADLVVCGGTIHSMDKSKNQFEALAISENKIVYVGDNSGVKEYIGENTRVINLNGESVVPGFVDSHTHPATNFIIGEYLVNLFDLDPVEDDYLNAIKDFAKKNPDTKAILGQGFQLNAFPDTGPSKAALDAISDQIPIVMIDSSFHVFWANSKAIEMSGITKDTPDPEGSIIARDEEGNPSGYFIDAYVFDEVMQLGAITVDIFEKTWLLWQAQANSYGITSFSSGGANAIYEPDSVARWKMSKKLEENGKLSLRCNMPYLICGDEINDDTIGAAIQSLDQNKVYESDFRRIQTVKVYVDGVVEGKSALLLEPYAVDDTTCGYSIMSQEELDRLVYEVNKHGYGIHMHTITDGSARMGVNAIERARKATGNLAPRNTLAHLTLLDPSDMPRMAENDIIGAVQPIWSYRDPVFSELELEFLGEERFERMHAYRSMIDAGVTITGSADYGVFEDYRPLAGMQVGATKCSPYEGEKGKKEFIRGEQEKTTLYEMLEAYTINGAYQMGMEDKLGSIEVGKLADIAILSANIFEIDIEDLEQERVLYTILDGKIVYTDEALDGTKVN